MRHGIPTVYREVRFRSRLEAIWASWFDSVEWPWSYEPFDLNGYIPDFVLRFPGGHVLAEVKPILAFDELEAEAPKLVGSGWNGRDMLILGAQLFVDRTTRQGFVGLLGERMDDGSWGWGGAPLGICHSCLGVSFCHAEQSFTCRPCGVHPGGTWPMDDMPRLNSLWHDAKNRLQWHPGDD